MKEKKKNENKVFCVYDNDFISELENVSPKERFNLMREQRKREQSQPRSSWRKTKKQRLVSNSPWSTASLKFNSVMSLRSMKKGMLNSTLRKTQELVLFGKKEEKKLLDKIKKTRVSFVSKLNRMSGNSSLKSRHVVKKTSDRFVKSRYKKTKKKRWTKYGRKLESEFSLLQNPTSKKKLVNGSQVSMKGLSTSKR